MTDTNRITTTESSQDAQTWQPTTHTEPPEPIEHEPSRLNAIIEHLYTLETIDPSEIHLLGAIPPNSQTIIPSYFPPQITALITPIPFIQDGNLVHNLQQTAVSLISTIFPPHPPPIPNRRLPRAGTAQHIRKPQPLAHGSNHRDHLHCPKDRVPAPRSRRRVPAWLGPEPDRLPPRCPGRRVQGGVWVSDPGRNIANLMDHVWITTVSQSPPNFDIEIEECENRCYKPAFTAEMVRGFVEALPKVDVKGLEVEDRECGICREVYGEGEAEGEEAVRLGCGHVLGEKCLGIMIGDWKQRSCPLCRRPIALFAETPLSKLLGL
ncbi:hypothetical protein G7Y79_00078g100010 [Physcia stellaris]|nr:hypothetical protein G7Y79_00078g100010 [Physcia stellaris]